jgi:hypothetical protein
MLCATDGSSRGQHGRERGNDERSDRRLVSSYLW